jgi:hypothetical protein
MSIVPKGSLYVAGGAVAGMVALGLITIQRHKGLDTLFDYPRTTLFGYPRPEAISWDIPTISERVSRFETAIDLAQWNSGTAVRYAQACLPF